MKECAHCHAMMGDQEYFCPECGHKAKKIQIVAEKPPELEAVAPPPVTCPRCGGTLLNDQVRLCPHCQTSLVNWSKVAGTPDEPAGKSERGTPLSPSPGGKVMRTLLVGLCFAIGITLGYFILFGRVHAFGASVLVGAHATPPDPVTAPVTRRGEIAVNRQASYQLLTDFTAYIDGAWCIIGKVRKTQECDLSQITVQYRFFDTDGSELPAQTATIVPSPANAAEGFISISIPDKATEYRFNSAYTN